jgi:hypothetical protein
VKQDEQKQSDPDSPGKRDRWHKHPALVAVLPPVVTALLAAGSTIYFGRTGQLPDALNPAPPAVTVSATATETATVVSAGPTITVTTQPGTDPVSPTLAAGAANIADLAVGPRSFIPEVAEINGATYATSSTTRMDLCAGAAKEQRYQLSRHYSRFVVTAGVTDPSEPELKVQFRIYLDGKEVQPSVTLGKGTSRKIDISLNKALEMKLQVVRIASNKLRCDPDGRAAWGDPVVS